ncbi:hypothetical protein K456DRAFT_795807 [Colletotrichum gloeosporioides 23]|nr:hypothetical protein K456DRAFT_795807 [Colletotrichum gloeosporioides 23]
MACQINCQMSCPPAEKPTDRRSSILSLPTYPRPVSSTSTWGPDHHLAKPVSWTDAHRPGLIPHPNLSTRRPPSPLSSTLQQVWRHCCCCYCCCKQDSIIQELLKQRSAPVSTHHNPSRFLCLYLCMLVPSSPRQGTDSTSPAAILMRCRVSQFPYSLSGFGRFELLAFQLWERMDPTQPPPVLSSSRVYSCAPSHCLSELMIAS